MCPPQFLTKFCRWVQCASFASRSACLFEEVFHMQADAEDAREGQRQLLPLLDLLLALSPGDCPNRFRRAKVTKHCDMKFSICY